MMTQSSPHTPGTGKRGVILVIAVFLLLALAQSAYFIQRVAPLSIPDPDMHALSTYALATGQSLNATIDNVDKYGNPIKDQPITGDARYLMLVGLNSEVIFGSMRRARAGDPAEPVQRTVDAQQPREITVPFSGHTSRTNQYIPLVYIPQAIGLRVAMSLGSSPYTSWQWARVTNLLCYLIVSCVALLLMPRYRGFMALILLLPPVMFVASSLMIDGMIIAWSACFAALLMRIVEHDVRATGAQLAALGLLAFALLCEKIVYAAVIGLVLLLGKRVATWKRKVVCMAWFVVPALLIYLPWHAVYGSQLAIVNIADNVTAMIHNPWRCMSAALASVFLWPSDFGKLPKRYGVMAAMLLVVWLWLLTRSVLRTRRRGLHAIAERRFAIAVIALILAEMLATAMFLIVTWNDVSQLSWFAQLQGLQGRYVLPALPLLPLTLCTAGTGGARTVWRNKSVARP